MSGYFVYMLSNKKDGVLYTGVTSDLTGRIYQHKNKLVEGFTEKYNLDKLVYYEPHIDVNEAILREKRIKEWKRAWKVELVEGLNPEWKDLYDDICA